MDLGSIYGKQRIRNIRVDSVSDEKREPPISAGVVLYNQRITGIGNGGTGMFKIGSFVVFVNESVEGKSYDVRVQNVLPTCAFAEIITDDDAF